jgi:hypothetical protein
MSSKFHRQIGAPKIDPPEAIAERKRYAAIAEQVNAEVRAKFYPLNEGADVEAILAWKEQRIAELIKAVQS